MPKLNNNGKSKHSIQSTLTTEQYGKVLKRLKQLSQELNIDLTESAYIKKLILEDAKKGDSS